MKKASKKKAAKKSARRSAAKPAATVPARLAAFRVGRDVEIHYTRLADGKRYKHKCASELLACVDGGIYVGGVKLKSDGFLHG